MTRRKTTRESAAAAIESWIASDGDRIYGLALKLCRSRAEAEDLVQDTFLQAFRKWRQFEGRSQPTSWLYTIASRLCRRRQRRRAGEPGRLESLSELLPGGEPTVAAIPAADEGPLAAHLRKEAEERVEWALARLPVHLRLPLVLKDIAELSAAQVGEILGIKQATVKTRVHRARLALRRELAEVLPRRPLPPADHPRRVCMDLLAAKQEALDRGVDFPVPRAELCSRCQSLLSTLDLTYELCRQLPDTGLPTELRQAIADKLAV